MKKITAFILHLGIALCLSFAARTVLAKAHWDMPTPYGDKEFHTINIRQFADEVRNLTDGALDIRVHSAGSLIKHPEIKNAVRRGMVPIGELIMSRLGNEDPLFELDSVPYLATSYEEAWSLYQATREKLQQKLQAQRLQLLFSIPWQPQGLFTKFPVSRADDLHGIKMRVYNRSSERLAELMGTVPTQTEAPDIPTAFSTGRVDAMVTSPSTGANTQAWDYLSDFNHAQLWLPKNMVIVNLKAFNALDPSTREAVLQAAEAAERRGWEMSRQETDAKIAIMREHGVNVSIPSSQLQQDLRDIGRQMIAEWLETAGAEGQEVLDRYNDR